MPQKTDIITLTRSGWLAGCKGPNGNFIKRKTIQLFRIMQQVTAAQSPGLGVRMLEWNRTPTSDSLSDLGKDAWDLWAQSQTETFGDPKCGEDSRSLTMSNQIKTL